MTVTNGAVSATRTADRLVLSRALADDLLDHARGALPHEACGLLAGRRADGRITAFHPARNEHACALRFSVHPEDLVRIVLGMEAAGEELVAVFHSHVGSAAVPSATDVRESRYPDALHLLASIEAPWVLPEQSLRAWSVGPDGAAEVPLLIG